MSQRKDTVRHMLHALNQIAEDRQHALAIANSASMFLIQRCDMIEVNPFLGFVFLRHLCDRNIDNFLKQSMQRTADGHNIELDDKLREEMTAIVEAMQAALLHDLQEKEISLEDES